MNSYRVSFYKNLCNSDGHSFKCLQRQVDVQSTGSSEALILAERLVDNERLGAECIWATTKSNMPRDRTRVPCKLTWNRVVG